MNDPALIAMAVSLLAALIGWLKNNRETHAKLTESQIELTEMRTKLAASEVKESQARAELVLSETRRTLAEAKAYESKAKVHEETATAIKSGRYDAIVAEMGDRFEQAGDAFKDLAQKHRSLPPPKASP